MILPGTISSVSFGENNGDRLVNQKINLFKFYLNYSSHYYEPKQKNIDCVNSRPFPMAPATTSEQTADEYFEYRFAHQVTPEHHQVFLRCQEELKTLVKKYPGYISEDSTELRFEGGIFVSETVLRFDTLENFIRWIDSQERRQLIYLEENSGYQFEGKVNAEGYGRWLNRKLSKPSPTWKINLLVLLVLYPTVMVFNLLFKKPDFIDFSSWMLFGNFCSVAITGWFAVPWVSGIYQHWLEGKGTKKEQWWALGSIIVVLLLLLQFFRGVSSYLS